MAACRLAIIGGQSALTAAMRDGRRYMAKEGIGSWSAVTMDRPHAFVAMVGSPAPAAEGLPGTSLTACGPLSRY